MAPILDSAAAAHDDRPVAAQARRSWTSMSSHALFHCPNCRRLVAPASVCARCSRVLHREPLQFLIGRQVGPYRVEQLIGVGGVGAVYLARKSLDAPAVALKLMYPDDEDENAEARFLLEAQMLRELRHPNIVRAEDVARSEWGPPYYTMEWLSGPNLRQVLRDHPAGLPLGEVLEHARQLAAGLQYAHDSGLIHRDVKPENVLVVPAGASFIDKLLDFGFAKWVVGRRQLRMTADGDVIGTPAYLTPEQVGLAPPGPATDQYALALVIGEMLTGRKMRQGLEPFEIVTREVQAPLPVERLAGPELPEHIVRALVRATAPRPQDRFADVEAFVDGLEGRRRSLLARRPRRWRPALLVALLALLTLAAALWLVLGPAS
ncbi:MAG: serine/threonine protein kinase [Acidobacteria bacterium]|nr:serine/threonine protein kinase [Acidobacteriota bacterium]